MGLHMVDTKQRDLPGSGQTLCRVETDGKIGAHARTAGDGDEVGLSRVGQVLYGLLDQQGQRSLVGFEGDDGVDAIVGACIGSDLLVEVKGGSGTWVWCRM